MAHHPVDVVYTERVAPAPVVFGTRTVPETRALEGLVAIQNDDDWWLFVSGRIDGLVFHENDEAWQLLNGTLAFGALQRIGLRDEDAFMLILKDNA